MNSLADQPITTAQANSTRRSMLAPLLTLLCLTLVTQLASVAYRADVSLLKVLLPSALVLCAVTIPLAALGLVLGTKIGLGAPLLTDLLNRREGCGRQLILDTKLAVPLGLGLGVLLLMLRFAIASFLPPELPAFGHRGVLGGILVSIGAAVGEEVWLRLGVLTILAWALVRMTRRRDVDRVVGWSSVVVSALAFGAIHLPQLASYGAASPIGIAGTMFGNTLVGILFGWLYWRRSLIAAMIAHLAVDVVLHVLPAFWN